MSEDTPLEYWTPSAPMVPSGPAGPLLTGPAPARLVEMLGVVVLASSLALGIVAALAWVLA
jgi:hypothetical protein